MRRRLKRSVAFFLVRTGISRILRSEVIGSKLVSEIWVFFIVICVVYDAKVTNLISFYVLCCPTGGGK